MNKGLEIPRVYYLNKEQGPLAREINAVIGRVHGDLNCNNLIVNKNIMDKSFDIYLIDYSHYKNDGFLFDDHAYLQLDLLLTTDAIANIYEWNKRVLDDFEIGNDRRKYNYQFMRYIRDGIVTFIKSKQPKNETDCWLQYWCTQISAGLNWMNKRGIDNKRQALCLLYASISLKNLLEILSYPIMEETEAVLTVLGTNTERDIWKTLDKFNAQDNRYILITSCDSEKISKEEFASFSTVKWEGIFEITTKVSNEISQETLSKLKSKHEILYKSFPETSKTSSYEFTNYWCSIQVPSEGNVYSWYRRNIRDQMEKLIKSIMSVRENYPTYIIVDARDINKKLIEEIIVTIQLNSNQAFVQAILLDNEILDLEADTNFELKTVEYSLANIAKCVDLAFSQETDTKKIRLPKKDGKKVTLEDDEANYVSIDFEIIHLYVEQSESDRDGGDAFYHGAEPTWRDIAEHRDQLRDDYICKWKQSIADKIKSIGSDTVIACNLFHRAGAGGTTLSKRILWDFHTKYPCLIMKKIGSETIERLKLIYDRTTLPILVVVEITAGNITQIDITNLRIAMLNKGIRALFICVSRIHNLEAERYSNNFYLASTPEMTMSPTECQNMYNAYKKMTAEDKCLENLYKLTFLNESEWQSLRQPFFYGLFTFDKDYTNIQEFIRKGMDNIDDNMFELIKMLAFMTNYSQMGLNKYDIKALFGINFSVENKLEINSLIVNKNIGYQICHPIIAEKILKEILGDDDNYINMLFEYSKNFIDRLTDVYDVNSNRLSDIFEEIFTHREYYVDEEKRKFSNLIMEFGDQEKKKILVHLTKKVPENPHYYNHLARVYIYPSEKGKGLDFDKAASIATTAIDIAERNEVEGVGIHHHLLGKIFTKQCKAMVSYSRRYETVKSLWREIQPIYNKADIEFEKCKTGNNAGFGLVGQIELISSTLKKISDKKGRKIDEILKEEPKLRLDFVNIFRKMHELSTLYTMRFGTENIAYKRAMTDWYHALGNVKQLEKQLSLKKLTLQDRIYTRQALAAMKFWGDKENGDNLYNMSEEKLNRIFELLNQNIEDSSMTKGYDRIMWIKVYMRLKDYNVFDAYHFLMEWPDGNKDYFVCFYRYVLGFLLYYNGQLDYYEVERHLKQSNALSKNLYGISTTSTRELVGKDGENIYLIPDNSETEIGKMSNEEREKYRDQNCKFFQGQITEFQNSLICIRFSLDNVHSFIAKMPASDSIGGVNVGDTVRFALGFSYSEMRAWNISHI